jgi:hypothetical protein
MEDIVEHAHRLVSHLPGVELSTSWGRPALKVNGKAFAGLSRVPGALWVLCPLELKELLIEADPDVFFETDHYRGWPAVLVRAETADDDKLAARLEGAWAGKAPRKLVKAWAAEAKGTDRGEA